MGAKFILKIVFLDCFMPNTSVKIILIWVIVVSVKKVKKKKKEKKKFL